MKDSFETFLFEKLQVHPSGRILLAVSGGMDSMCMWHLFRRSRMNISVAHCNFKLRDEASDLDMEFVRTYANGDEEVFTREFDCTNYAEEHDLSIQMAARELRYGFFEEIMNLEHFDYLATAHHLDDQIETFFVQLLRKGNFPSLSGMPVRNEKIIRPLMFATRESIEEYVREHEVPYREDESNKSDIYLRNRIRRNLIPVLQKVRPDFKSSILEIMSDMREISDSMEEYFAEKKHELLRKDEQGTGRLSIAELKKLDFPLYFLESLMRSYAFHRSQAQKVLDALDGESGKVFYSPTHRLIKDREDLIIDQISSENKDEVIILKKDLTEQSEFFVKASVVPFYRGIIGEYPSEVALLDLDLLPDELVFRKWRSGDAFYPLGLGGRKKLSDFFTDKKYSLAEKERQWIMCGGENVIWIVGKQIDDRYKIRENTKHVLLLELQ